MKELMIAAIVFMIGYGVNMFYITVLYHRGLTHQALVLKPWLIKLVGATGTWVTGLEPKAWICMHRLHHMHSDQAKDPHSPVSKGIWNVWVLQYNSYKRILYQLNRSNLEYVKIVSDIPFGISLVNRYNLSWMPYLVHSIVALALYFTFDSSLVGAAYFLGIISHPLQGWMVNALAHSYGGRNFETNDNSRNNLFVGWFVFGEGFQNNHHAFPEKANFAHKWFEFDMGYWLCLVAQGLGWLKISPKKNISTL